jgi:hypothetical protein
MLGGLLIPAVLFFALGMLAHLVRSDLKFPELAKGLSIYLLLGIGLHGGMELAKADIGGAIQAVTAAFALGILLPLIAYAILRWAGRMDTLNSAAIAAHYGSVSAGTFLTALAFLETQNITHETYPVIMLAIMESPAIIIGLLLAKLTRPRDAAADLNGSQSVGKLLHEAFTNGSVILLFGGIAVGAFALPDGLQKIMPFYDSIFMGVLSLFLLEMGMEAAKRIGEFRRMGLFLVGFGIIMPLIGAGFGLATGYYLLGFSPGGTMLVGILAASASYIAVPSAMRLAIPEANPSFYLTLALGVTFPFNVIVGIPLYWEAAQWLAQ